MSAPATINPVRGLLRIKPALLRRVVPPAPLWMAIAMLDRSGRLGSPATTPPIVPVAVLTMLRVLAEPLPMATPAATTEEGPRTVGSIQPELVSVTVLPVRFIAVPPLFVRTPTVAPGITVMATSPAVLKFGISGLAAPLHATLAPVVTQAA